MKHSSRAGFTILELSVVLAVISLIVGSALAIGATRIQAAKIQDTETKMKAIVDMLDSFVQTYGYVPCPADPQALTTDSTFGDGSLDPATNNTCRTDRHLLPSGLTRIGVVPTATLGLAPSVMMDGWNRRITYAVDTRFIFAGTPGTPGGYVEPTPNATTDDFLVILSASPRVVPQQTTTVTNKAVFVLISYGADGHGAWRAKGGATTIAADPVPTDVNQLQNTNNDNVFVQRFRTETFDDVVYYRMQWQFPCIRTPDANPFKCP
jgi:prepilin-type N-terminal cleavage/methylation domain-containing protein